MYTLFTLGQKFGTEERHLDPENHPYSITIEMIDKREAKGQIYSMAFVSKILKATNKEVPKSLTSDKWHQPVPWDEFLEFERQMHLGYAEKIEKKYIKKSMLQTLLDNSQYVEGMPKGAYIIDKEALENLMRVEKKEKHETPEKVIK